MQHMSISWVVLAQPIVPEGVMSPQVSQPHFLMFMSQRDTRIATLSSLLLESHSARFSRCTQSQLPRVSLLDHTPNQGCVMLLLQMAASPIPHFLQPKFLAARRHLLARLRSAHSSGSLQGTVAGELFSR